MNTTSIIIEKGWVTILPIVGGVWPTQHEIADTFDVFLSYINSIIRYILKSKVLLDTVCRRKDNCNGSIFILYNMEIITALAFRLKSRRAQYFREWITSQTLNPAILWKNSGMDIMLN